MLERRTIDELLRKEGIRVEWKENVADAEGVVKTLAAFANDYALCSGGWVLCGVKESKDEHGFPVAEAVGLEANRYRELRKKVPALCRDKVDPPLVPAIYDEPAPHDSSRRILVFSMAASDRVHWVRSTKDGRQLWYRVDSNTYQASNAVILELMRRKGEMPPFLDEACPGARVEDLDTRFFAEFSTRFQLPRPWEDYLQPDVTLDARTPPLVVGDPATGTGIPTRLAILLMGHEPARFVRGAAAVLAIYHGAKRSEVHSQRFDLGGALPVLMRAVLERINAHVGLDIDKSASILDGLQNRARYSRRALEEAIVNAFVHRDYVMHEPVRIDIFNDRIEIWSPGGPPHHLAPAELSQGGLRPVWRNASLVSFLVALGWAQNLGQGLDTIIETSLEISRKRPDIQVKDGYFGVVLYAASPLVTTAAPDYAPAPSGEGRAGKLLISIGAGSIRDMVTHALLGTEIAAAATLVDFVTGYIEPNSSQWLETARAIREQINRWVEHPDYSTFHLFYRGPVVLAPLIGALVAPVKPLVLYHLENGRYFRAYTLDRRFLRGID